MRIVVSGTTGFLGGHVCRRLTELGHEVIGLGRDMVKGAALSVRFEAVDLVLDFPVSIEAGKGDCPPEQLRGACAALERIKNADGFIHCAAMSSAWGRYTEFYQANVTGTRNALIMAEALGVRRFVHVSSSSVGFAFRDQLNQPEDDPAPPPVNAYAATKAKAEAAVRAAPHINPIILRPRGIYGKGDTALLPRLIRAAQTGAVPLIRNGATVIDLTHVSDVTEAVVRALETPATGTYNISGGEALSIRHIITQSAAASGVPVRFAHLPYSLAITAARMAEGIASVMPGSPEPPVTAYGIGLLSFNRTLDLTAARRDLGYEPRVPFAEGLRQTFA